MQKKGISTLVATVLVVLVSVGAIGVLWTALSPLVEQVAYSENPSVVYEIEPGEFTYFDPEDGVLCLRVSRSSDSENIVAHKLVITDSSGNTIDDITADIVTPNSARVYCFQGLIDPVSASVTPIYDVSGQEIEGFLRNSIETVSYRNGEYTDDPGDLDGFGEGDTPDVFELQFTEVVKISDGLEGFGGTLLEASDHFGSSITPVGDLDGNGVTDLLVGARLNDEPSAGNSGAVYLLYMELNGPSPEVLREVKIAKNIAGFFESSLEASDNFGSSVLGLGDYDGAPSTIEFIVGAYGDENGDNEEGAFYILNFNTASDTLSRYVKVSDGLQSFNPDELQANDRLGLDVTRLDGTYGDAVIGAYQDESSGGNPAEGAIYIFNLGTSFKLSGVLKISDGLLGFDSPGLENQDHFGASVEAIGDINGDSIEDLAVGAFGDEGTGSDEGAVYILFMNSTGGVDSFTKITDNSGGLADGTLSDDDEFGISLAALGDIDNDGVPDIAVGAQSDDTMGSNHGAVYIFLLNNDGSVKETFKLVDGAYGLSFNSLDNSDFFGSSLAATDINNDGSIDLLVGARTDEATEANEGAFYILLSDITN